MSVSTASVGGRWRAGNGAVSAVAIIAQRDIIKLRRDHLRLAVNLMFPVVMMIGLGTLLRPTVGRVSGLDTVSLAFTGVLAATMFQSAAAGMVSLVEDRERDFARELFITPVPRLVLMAGKVAGETVVALTEGGLIVAVALACGVSIWPRHPAAVAGSCLACALLGAGFGLVTAAAVPDQRTAMQVFQFLIAPQYVLAGVIVPLQHVGWLGDLGWAMPLRYGVDLTRAAYYRGTPGYDQVVALGPVLDVTVMAALFVVLLALGAGLWARQESHA